MGVSESELFKESWILRAGGGHVTPLRFVQLEEDPVFFEGSGFTPSTPEAYSGVVARAWAMRRTQGSSVLTLAAVPSAQVTPFSSLGETKGPGFLAPSASLLSQHQWISKLRVGHRVTAIPGG